MKFKDLLKWNARVSAVYAIGIWTMVGSYAYLKYTGRCEVAPGERRELWNSHMRKQYSQIEVRRII